MALRDRPIIKAARERLAENHPVAAAVAGAVAEGLREAAADPSSSVQRVDTPTVTAVAQAVAPIVQNATNQEPWWQSRVKIGTLIVAITMVARWFGYELPAVSDADMDIIYNVLTTFGGGIVGVGRWVKNLPPINWRRPWTIFGIGR